MIRAFVEGLRRVWRAPWVAVGIASYLVAGTMLFRLVPIPTRLAVREGFIGSEWLNLLGLPTGWSPAFLSLIGNGILFRGAGSGSFDWTMVQLAAFQTAAALFLDGGVFDRLARDRRVGASGFFAACGGYAGRLIRLGIVAIPVYWLLFAMAPPRVAIAVSLLLNPIFAYAKIRAVVEDRRSALGSIAAAFRFVRRHPLDVFGLHVLNALLFVAVTELQRLPVAGLTAPPPPLFWILSMLAMALVSLLFAASQIALFQSRLAHAGYTAAPMPKWPDSPAAEAMRLLD